MSKQRTAALNCYVATMDNIVWKITIQLISVGLAHAPPNETMYQSEPLVLHAQNHLDDSITRYEYPTQALCGGSDSDQR